MCFNRKVLGGLAAVALGVWLFAPNLLAGVAPILLVAACPLSMILMMRAMSGGQRQRQTEEAPSRAGRAEGHEAEIARLQAEIERLRAERAAEAPSPPASPPGRIRA